MTNPRDILNNIKWNSKYDFDIVEIWFVHRGAPNNTKVISGKDIVSLKRSFLHTTSASIPYHRIFKIIYKNKVIFNR
jgi:uncharacterized protein (UPF0248 family)